MKKIKLLFCGGVFQKNELPSIIKKSNGNVQLAANNFQWSLINGFEKNLNQPVDLFSYKFLGSYPKNYSDCIIKEKRFSHRNGANDVDLGFVNLAYIKHLIKPFHEKSILKNWIKTNNAYKRYYFIYSLNLRSIRLAKIIKKYDKDAIIVVSVNDLPNHIMKDKKNSLLKKLYSNYQISTVYRSLHLFNGFMLVSEGQNNYLKLTNDEYVIIEGISDCESDFTPLSIDYKTKNIVYAGTLSHHYNIMDLVDAFLQINDENARLIICGDGSARNDIIQKSLIDNRIIYKGNLPKDELNDVYNSAYCFVNPRYANQSFTNYSFPIKTIDYLLAGRPVICQKLEAIPEEYDNHLIYFYRDEDNNLVNTIKNVLTLPISKINEEGEKNYHFVRNLKNSKNQTQKILKLFNEKDDRVI